MLWPTAVGILACVWQGEPSSLPEPLEKSLAMRRAMRTATLRYQFTDMGHVPGKPNHSQVRRMEARIAGESYLAINFGDQDGIVWLRSDGQPALNAPFACAPYQALEVKPGESWRTLRDSYSVTHSSRGPGLYDPRCIGLEVYPLGHGFNDIQHELREAFSESSRPQIETSGQLITIRSQREFEAGALPKRRVLYRATFNRSQDYALVDLSIDMKPEGAPSMQWGRCETEYKLIDGYWFPAKYIGWQIRAVFIRA